MKYRVRIYKDYVFTSGMVGGNSFKVKELAYDSMEKELKEIASNQFKVPDATFYNVEWTLEQEWELKEKKEAPKKADKFSINEVCLFTAKLMFESKFGPLCPKKNRILFEESNPKNKHLSNITLYLKDGYAKEFNKILHFVESSFYEVKDARYGGFNLNTDQVYKSSLADIKLSWYVLGEIQNDGMLKQH